MSHILEFLDLIDTPSTYENQEGKALAVNASADAIEFVTGVNAEWIDGQPVSAASPADGDVLVYDSVTDDQWENVTPPWLRKDGGAMTAGDLTLFQDPSNNMHATNKLWVETNFSAASHAHDSTYLKLDASNDPMTGTLEWTNAAGPSIMNEAATATNPTLIPNKADPDTGVGWNTTDVLSLIVGGVEIVNLASGTVTVTASDIVLSNNEKLQGKEAGGTVRDLIHIDTNAIVNIGNASNWTYIYGDNIYSKNDIRFTAGQGVVWQNVSETWSDVLVVSSNTIQIGSTAFSGISINEPVSSDITLANAKILKGKESGGTARNLATVNASNEVELGSSSLNLNLMGAQIDALPPLANTVYLQGEESGGTARNLVGMNSSNYLVLGNTTTTVIELQAASYVRLNNMAAVRIGDIAGASYVTIGGTDGNILGAGNAYVYYNNYISSADSLRSRCYETNMVKTLSDNVSQSFFKWSPTTQGDHGFWMIPYSIYVQYTILGTTYYFQQGGVYSTMMYYDGTNIDCTDSGSIGTPTTKNTGGGTVTVTLAAGGDGAPDRGPNFTVDLSGIGTTWVSGTIQYAVISCDSDHRGYSVFT